MTSTEPNVVISKKLVAFNALSLVLSRVLTIALMLWVNRHLLTRLDPEQYKPFPIVVAAVLILQVLTYGLATGLARHVTEAYARGHRERITEIVSSMLPIAYLATVVFLVLGFLLAWNVGVVSEINESVLADAQLMMVILVSSHALTLLMTPFSVGLHVRQKFSWLAVIRLAGLFVQIGVLVALLFGVDTRVLWVVVASESSTVLIAVVTYVLSRRLVPELRFRMASVNKQTMRELSSFGAWSMLGYLLYRIRTSSDVLILGKLGTETDLNSTAFHLASMPERQLDGLLGPAAAAIDPALTAMHATDDEAALRRTYVRGNRLYLWLVLGITVPLIVFAEELVRLYVGEALILAAPVLVLICLRYPFVYSNEMLYHVCMAKARIRAFYVVLTVSSAVKIAAACVLVGYYDMGALGAAWAALGVTIVTVVFSVWPLALRMVNMSFGLLVRETLWPGWIPGIVAGLVGAGMSWLVPASSWLTVLFDIAVMFAAHCVTVWLVARPEDREDMAAVLGKIRRKLGGAASAGGTEA